MYQSYYCCSGVTVLTLILHFVLMTVIMFINLVAEVYRFPILLIFHPLSVSHFTIELAVFLVVFSVSNV